ncbi:MAG: DUF559 domain-containing protein [Bifidobacterium sp.]|nr:DUF559 domain-containing protein [Bifidobacterium sp.]
MGSIQASELALTKRAMEERCAAAVGDAAGQVVFGPRESVVLMGAELPKELMERGKLVRVVGAPGERRETKLVRSVVWTGPLETERVRGNVYRLSAECAWVMMAAWVSVDELVILGECLMLRDKRLKRMTLDSLGDYMAKVERWVGRDTGRKRHVRGLGKCRAAMRVMREDTDSSYESRMRLLLLRRGFGNAEVNVTVRNEHRAGYFLLDAAFRRMKVAVEYDGKQHAGQWSADQKRQKDLEDMGWTVLHACQEDLEDPEMVERFVDRVANAVRSRTGEDFRPLPPMDDRMLFDRRRRRHRQLEDWWDLP